MMRNKFIFAIILALTTIGCTMAGVTSPNSNTNMAAASPTPVSNSADQGNAASGATQQSPDALVADLYKQHDAKHSPFFQSKNRGLVDKYFTKSLADSIWKDATRKNQNEIGVLDGDPLYNAQDVQIKNFKVGAADVKSDRATVHVTFNNYDEKQDLKFSLVQEKGTWKISDIDYGEAGTLVKWFKSDNSSSSNSGESPSGEFEGKYQVGDTSCTVAAVKMAYEVRWAKGSGSEMFFADGGRDNAFTSENKSGANTFEFNDDTLNGGTFHRADGKDFAVRRIKY
jgi:hypothetical protein